MTTSDASDQPIVHTPGPWRKCGGVTPGYVAICDQENRYIVYGLATPEACGHEYKARCVKDTDEQQANARLMASSPELLEVLKKFMDFKDSDYVPNALFDRARTAIAKATGEVV